MLKPETEKLLTEFLAATQEWKEMRATLEHAQLAFSAADVKLQQIIKRMEVFLPQANVRRRFVRVDVAGREIVIHIYKLDGRIYAEPIDLETKL